MILYLIRHAKTKDDIEGIPQVEGSQITVEAYGQLDKTLENLRKQAGVIDYIASSPYRRAVQSADHLFKNRSFEILKEAHEYVRPEHLNKLSRKELIHYWEVEQVKNKFNPFWKERGGESFHDIKQRAEKIHQHVQAIEESEAANNMVIVGHGIFFRHLLGVMFIEGYRPEHFYNLLLNGINLKNGGFIKIDVSNNKLLKIINI